MHRLICAFVVHIWQKQVFSWHGSWSVCFSCICLFILYALLSSLPHGVKGWLQLLIVELHELFIFLYASLFSIHDVYCMFCDYTYLNLPDDGWWIGPKNRLVGDKYGARATDGRAFLFELGEFANLTVIGSVAPGGICPLSFCIARSASNRWSNRIKPTPLERPVKRENLNKCMSI